MDHNKFEEIEVAATFWPQPPHFLDMGMAHLWLVLYVGCTWLMYSSCMAHMWPMYDLHMAMSGAGDLWPCSVGLPSTVPWPSRGRF